MSDDRDVVLFGRGVCTLLGASVALPTLPVRFVDYQDQIIPGKYKCFERVLDKKFETFVVSGKYFPYAWNRQYVPLKIETLMLLTHPVLHLP